jgi:methylmalonyl-CoA mutase cobalamin-binding domain/chain
MSEEDLEELDLTTLNDDELKEQMWDDLYDGLLEELEEGTREFLARGWSAPDIMDKALIGGMRIVGDDFRDGILFVPEVLLAANAMKNSMKILRPLLTASGVKGKGRLVIGTVKGDIHDIGQNLVTMMMEGAGFEVKNIGINNPAENYIQALQEFDADILGMSALLTTTMPYMKVVIEELEKQQLRDKYFIMVGGAPLNQTFADAVGADAWGPDAGTAVEIANAYMDKKNGKTQSV